MCSLHWQEKTYYSIETMSGKLRQLWIAAFMTAGFNTSSNGS